MAIDDNTTYGLTGAQVKDLANKVAQSGGSVRTISSADFNWNSNLQSATEPYDSVALWLLPTGVYTVDNPGVDFPIFSNSDGRTDYCDPSNDSTIISIVNPQTTGETATITIYAPGNPASAVEEIYVVNDTGVPTNGGYLESTFHTPRYGMDVPFALAHKESGTPTNNGAVGFVGDLYVDTDVFSLYVCTSRDDTDPDNPVCTWALLASV